MPSSALPSPPDPNLSQILKMSYPSRDPGGRSRNFRQSGLPADSSWLDREDLGLFVLSPNCCSDMVAMWRKAITSFGGIATRAVGSVAGAYRGIAREAADAVVIGTGVVGIAVARELASKGREVLVVEAASTFGTGTSSRNSEVIHAGIYYPSTSLKTKLCLRGRELLYKYCSDREIAHKRVGKVIVATSDGEIPKFGTSVAVWERQWC